MQSLKSIGTARFFSLGISISLGGSIFLFYQLVYPHHLYFQEQNQMFLFTIDYLQDRISHPGGFCEYLSSFLVQFYIHSWLGALVLALLSVVLQRLTLLLLHKLEVSRLFDIISVVPCLLYWILLCNENYMLTVLIAQLFVLLSGIIYIRTSRANVRVAYLIIGLLLLYIVAGGIYWTYGILVVLGEIIYFKQLSGYRLAAFVLAGICITTILPLISKYIFIMPYPLETLWKGTGYYRFATIFPPFLFVVWIATVCLPFVMCVCSQCHIRNQLRATILLIICTYGVGASSVCTACDMRKESEMKYDYFLRYGLWNRIMKESYKSLPDTPFEMMITNLSLAQTGRMGDCMFHYPGNRQETLLPSFSQDFRYSFAIADIYYHLGLINMAQRLTFEGMESIPDAQKSSRAIKRLVETNLVNGSIEVAHKYMRLLERALFYRVWVKKLSDKEELTTESNWRKLKAMKPENDFLFSENSTIAMLESLINSNPDNRIACEYLLAYTLLKRDLKNFIVSLPLMKKWHKNGIPIHYQEALMQIWFLNGSQDDSLSIYINVEIVSQFKRFMQIYRQNPKDERLKDFSGTYWHYYYNL